MTTTGRRARSLAFVGAAVLAVLLMGGDSARAHAALTSSTPADGSVLAESPERVTLSFTEPIDLELTQISVVGTDGEAVPTTAPANGANAREGVVGFDGDLGDGVYTVTWRTVSTTDTHQTAGAFTFGVGVDPGSLPSGGATTETASPSPFGVAGRIALYAGLAVLLGAVFGAAYAIGTPAVRRPWVLGVAWCAVAFGAVATTLAERAALGVPLGTLLGSDAGGAYVRLLVAAAVLGAAVLATTWWPTRATLAILAVTALATVVIRVEGGHASGSPLEVALQTIHVAGVAAWIGGLAWLVLSVRRRLDAEVVRRFSTLAAIGLGALALTGILRASDELGFSWWLHPFRDGYSTALAIKVAAFVALVALGAVNRFRNVPRFGPSASGPLIRTVGAELGIAVVVFGLTGLMTGLPPQGSTTTPRERVETLVVSGSDFATTTTVVLEMAPGDVGPNAFTADVRDYDTREPVDATSVSLRFSFPDRPAVDSTLALDRGARGAWIADGTNLSLFGTWNVTALVEMPTGSVEVPLLVTPRPTDQDVSVSRVAGQPDLFTFTLADGVEIQAYVDPGAVGRTNQVHLTAFDDAGAELPLRSATIVASVAGGAIAQPEVQRFGPGHFVANLDLTPGAWTFALSAETRDGEALHAVFERDFGG